MTDHIAILFGVHLRWGLMPTGTPALLRMMSRSSSGE